jgi:transposase
MVRDIVGLYMNPPDRALVLCVDEKPQIQATEGTAPVRPMRPGQVERHTHDDIRHGTTDLFAALDVKTGTVIGTCRQRHRAVEFRAFLDQIDRSVPPDLDVHLVLDNASTHKAALIQQWLLTRSHYHIALHANIRLVAESRRGMARLAERPPTAAGENSAALALWSRLFAATSQQQTKTPSPYLDQERR